MLESLRPEVDEGDSEVSGGLSLGLKLLFDCQSLVHGTGLQGLRESVELDVHVLVELVDLVLLLLLLLGKNLLGLLLFE